MLDWDEYDVLAVLEAIPKVDEYETTYMYVVKKDGLRLNVEVSHLDGDIKFELINECNGQQVFFMRLIDCECVKRVKGCSGEYLKFASSKCFGSRYDEVQTINYGVKVSINPSINVSLC